MHHAAFQDEIKWVYLNKHIYVSLYNRLIYPICLVSWACIFKNRTLLIVTLEADKGHKNRRQMGIRIYSTAYRQVLKSTVLHTVTTWCRHDNGKRTRPQNYSYHCAFLNNSYDHAEVVYVLCMCPWKCSFTAQHWWLQFLCLNQKKVSEIWAKTTINHKSMKTNKSLKGTWCANLMWNLSCVVFYKFFLLTVVILAS